MLRGRWGGRGVRSCTFLSPVVFFVSCIRTETGAERGRKESELPRISCDAQKKKPNGKTVGAPLVV